MSSAPARPCPSSLRRSLLLLVPVLACLAPGAAAQERFTVAGDRVAIYNLAGRTRVERGTGNAVMVEVTRGGRDGGRLQVEQGPVGGRATLRVVYPGDRIAYPQGGGRTELRVRDDGTFGGTGRGREGRRVRLDREGEVEAWADLRVLVPAGRDVELRVAVGEMSARGVSANLLLDTHAGGVTAEDLRGRIRIDTGSGEVLASGIEGELDVDTGSGDVVVRNARVGTLGVDTGSGAVTLEAFRADALQVDTGSGGVRGGGDAEEVEVDTGSGDIPLDLGPLLRNVEVDTGSGDVTLTVPANYGAQVSLETSSGDLEVNLPLQVVRRGQDALEGTIGDGAGRLTVDTGSGNITVRRR